ncbi:MAG: peptidoglycan-binding protein [Methanobrevibacter sp.]|uniref:peptidoglycan-binding protein n=1 Tax=Methanobrevibacter sp. TaxID=66852 RepID=UPI001B3F844C|nr:peptidoglycan-binding protein [Methanobrevibacter sp.]MBP3791286.1 peptidoglycan-binding protein [Methanobrevibacter sp.]
MALVVFLLSIAGVSASEIGDTIASENTNTIELSTDNDIIEDNLQTSEENEALASTDYDEAIAQTDTEVLGADSATYSDLAKEIGHSGNITLTHKNYTYTGGETITISEANKVIDGNGAVIDMNGSTIRAFYISASDVTIKNLTIKNANYEGDGGAIYFTSSGTVKNCNFTNNQATNYGGAIWVSSGTVENCNFTNNQATNKGGAVYFSNSGSVINCNFVENKATGNYGYGGAVLFNDNSNGEVINCNFAGNSAAVGGAVWMYYGSVKNSNCTGNSAIRGGGAISILQGSVENCNIADNYVNTDGVVIMYQGSVKNCNFTNNKAETNGGAVYFGSNFNNTAINCYFANNNATNDGGAIYRGSAINCTFIANRAQGNGDAMYNGYYLDCIGQEEEYVDCEVLDLYFEVSDFNSTYKSDKEFLITLKGQDRDINFMNTDVVIYKNGNHVKTYSCLSGGALIFDLAAGNYTAELRIPYPNLDPKSKNVTVTISRIALKIEASCNETTYSENVVVNVKSDMSGDYVVTVGDKTQTVTLEANVVKNVTFTGISANETGHVINVTYIDSENYTGLNGTVRAVVHKASTAITAAGITATYNIDRDLVVTLKDASGNALSGVKVTVDLNGAKTYTTDNNGQVKVSTKGLAPKAYTAKVTFNGNTNYDKSTKDVKVTVKKATPKLTAKKKTFKTSVKTKKYAIILKDNTGKAITKAKVTLKVKGKTYKATTNSKGKAVFKIKNLKKKGTFKATITYKGNKYYNKVSKKANIKVIVTFKTVSKGSKDKSTVKEIQQALKDKGYYISYKGHYLKVDGKFKSCTERSVKQFQKDNGLKVTGKVDEKTAHKLGII